ncbi:MAG: NAD(P)/FAD-dependent oxidoreductase [Bacillota bacterium]
MQTEYDVIIAGGGVVGTAIARELARLNLSIALFEKAADVASGTSKANSGIIHAGYNASEDTLKGQLNLQANPMFDQIAEELNVPFARIGSLVVGFTEEDKAELNKMKESCKSRPELELEILDEKQLKDKEPNINPAATSALFAPTAGVISPYKLTIAQAENAAQNGVDVYLKTAVEEVQTDNGHVKGVKTEAGTFTAPVVINAAGLYADEIAATVGEDYEIKPRKGEYNLFDKKYDSLVNHVIFPMPSEKSKGILITPTVDGNIILGPNSNPVDDKDDLEVTDAGLDEIWAGGQKLFPALPRQGIITSFAGLRATLPYPPFNDDFKIEALPEPLGFIDVAGIQSPGLTCAPAIAIMVRGLVEDVSSELKQKLDLTENEDFEPNLNKLPRLDDYKNHREDWQEIYEQNPDYGEIVCRCEHVTRGEIIAELEREVTSPTLDGLKRRTRAGGGRCQGGFCGPKIAEIIAEELGISPLEVSKSGPGSEILIERVKNLKPDRDITYGRSKDEE